MGKCSFKEEHTLEERQSTSAKFLGKYPGRIPVIVTKAGKSSVPDIDKKKYMVPCDATVGQFVYDIRKRIKLSSETAIFLFVDNTLPSTGMLMSTLYDEKKEADGFLYVSYSGENTFGFQMI